jgi:hypothetical protein
MRTGDPRAQRLGGGDAQWKSPFDTCPCTTSPVSLTNLQVSGAKTFYNLLFNMVMNIS